MKILLTNDDGISSPFLKILAERLASVGKLTIVAPATEQSWIGKAMSRLKDVSVKKIDTFTAPAFALGGTPADCVNIALNHILHEKPDWIVSGINIGHNAGLACIASSGTVAAAVEGALHKIPSVAASIYLPPEVFDMLKDGAATELSPVAQKTIQQASQHIAEFISQQPHSESYGIVHNLNFPYKDLENTEVKKTVVAKTMIQSLFEPTPSGDYTFTYHEMSEIDPDGYTDRQCIIDGNISHSRIDYTKLST